MLTLSALSVALLPFSAIARAAYIPLKDVIGIETQTQDLEATANVRIKDWLPVVGHFVIVHHQGSNETSDFSKFYGVLPKDTTDWAEVPFSTLRTNWDRWRFGVGLEDQCCDLLTDDFYHSFELSEAGQNITFEIGGDMVWADFGGYKSTHPFRNQAPEFPDDGSTLLNSFFILNVCNNFNTNVKVEVALTTQDNFVQHQKTSRLKPDTSTCSAQGTAGHFFFESNSTKTFTETWTIRARIEGRYSKVAKNVALRIPPEAPDTGSVLLVVDEEGWAIWAAKKLGKGKWDAQGSEAEEEGEEALVYQEDL